MKEFSGRCHCGAVRITAETDLSAPFTCNCSFCIRRGAILQMVKPDQFEVCAGEPNLKRYGSREFSDHYFCNRCGIHVFSRISRGTEASIALNLACLEGVDLAALAPRVFDGARLL